MKATVVLLPLFFLTTLHVQGMTTGQAFSSPGSDSQYECELIIECDSTFYPYGDMICSITARIRNTGSTPGRIMFAEFVPESGLYLAAGQSPIIQMDALLEPGDTSSPLSWTVRSAVSVKPAHIGVTVTFTDSSGTSVACRDSIYIPAEPEVELSLNCSVDLTELEADPVRGGYMQDSVEVRLRIDNTGELAVSDLYAVAIASDKHLMVAGDSQFQMITRLDPGTPAVELIWRLKAAPRQTDDTVCVLVLVTGSDPEGYRIRTHECTVCLWIPKASDVTGARVLPLAEEISLEQNYPNPFNPSTNIEFSIPSHGVVRLAVFDHLGREVAVLTDRAYQAGTHSCRFTGEKLPSGVYMYRLGWKGKSVMRQMVLLR